MTEKMENKSLTEWEQIQKRVLSSFDCGNIAVRNAVDDWVKKVQETRDVQNIGEITHKFASQEVLDATVSLCCADIEKNITVFQFKIAKNMCLRARINLRVALGAYDGVFPDEDEDDHIAPEYLAVVRITKTAELKRLRNVVDFSIKLAESEGDDGDSEVPLPASLGGGLQQFASDLKEFIGTNGDQGRDAVARICRDNEFAEEVLNGDEMPASLRFLAKLVLEIGKNNRVLEKTRRMGFSSR